MKQPLYSMSPFTFNVFVTTVTGIATIETCYVKTLNKVEKLDFSVYGGRYPARALEVEHFDGTRSCYEFRSIKDRNAVLTAVAEKIMKNATQ